MLFSYLFAFLGLPILFAQWVGILAFRRGPRGASWILMLCGAIISALVQSYRFLSLLLPILGASGGLGRNDWLTYLPSFVGIFGSALFFVGFALHGLKAARTAERQAELEQLTAAMAGEIDRLKSGSRA